MENETTTVNTAESAVTQDDAESKIAALEKEKARLIEEGANWKVAALKYKGKKEDSDEDDEDKMRRIAAETLASSRLAEIAEEQDAIIQKTLKENKELRMATGKKDVVQATTSGSEGVPVKDTLITPEQMNAFKARGWTEKDIERYKKNMLRYGR